MSTVYTRTESDEMGNNVTVRARAALAAWRASVKQNFFETDTHLQSLVEHYGKGHLSDELSTFGSTCAGRLDDLVRTTNQLDHLPRIERYDGLGHRVEDVCFHPGYHELGRAVYGTGVMSRYATPGRELESLFLVYLYAQNGEAGHTCPFACTAGMIKILQHTSDPHDWLDRLLDPDYDQHFHASQFLTEVQGGSDVGANAVTSQTIDGVTTITGEKWFCSVIDADLFLVTARPVEAAPGTRGLDAYVVPRRRPDGTLNAFRIRRLKDKLGTRSMASAEVDFEGAWAHPVGSFRTILEVVINTSRVYNAVCSAGMMQRAWLEADAYARHRCAFGQPILGFPSVQRICARLRTEAYAARASTFAIAAMLDERRTEGLSGPDEAALRLLVNLNKYWTSDVGTTVIRDAIEILGGNGAIESFSVLPRLLRDSIVCEAWEGGHNVLCAQVLRDVQRFGLHQHLFTWLEQRGAPSLRLADARTRWDHLLTLDDERASLHIRDLVDELRPLVQATLLADEGSDQDPLVLVARDHLLALSEPGYDPLGDAALSERIEALAPANEKSGTR